MGFSLPFIKPFAMSNDNEMAAGYQLFFFEVGTEDPKPTYTDYDLTIANTHPIILDGAGRFECFLAGGPYKAILKTPVADGSATVWTVPKFSGTGSDSILVVSNIAALKALTPNAASQVLVLGYYTIGDGGGGVMTWDSGTSLSDDGINFKPDSILIGDPGRWVRDFAGPINLLWFGAEPGGVASSSAAFAAAIAYVTQGPGNTIEITPLPTENDYIFTTAVVGLDLGGFTLKVAHGAKLNFNLAPTIKCNFVAGPYSIFAGGQAIVFSADCTFEQGPYPEWWGALRDGATDDIVAIKAMFASGAKSWHFSNGTYAVVGDPFAAPSVTEGNVYSDGQVKDGATFYVRPGFRSLTTDSQVSADLIEALSTVTAVNVQTEAEVDAGTYLRAKAGTSSTHFKAGGVIQSNNVPVTITNSGNLMAVTIPANAMNGDSDSIEIFTYGKFTYGANSANLLLKYGAVQIDDIFTGSISANRIWGLRYYFVRTSSTTGTIFSGQQGTHIDGSSYKDLTGLDFTAPITLQFSSVFSGATGSMVQSNLNVVLNPIGV